MSEDRLTRHHLSALEPDADEGAPARDNLADADLKVPLRPWGTSVNTTTHQDDGDGEGADDDGWVPV